MRVVVCLSVVALSSCTCGEPPPSPIVDAGVIGDGPPVDPDAGPPLLRDAGPVVCEEDAHEDNDTRAAAVVLAQPDAVHGTFCGGDDDWFAVQAQPGCAVALALLFDSTRGDLDALLYDPAGQLVGSAQTLGDEEQLHVVANASGLFAARIRGGARDDVPYALTLTATCPVDLTCPADDALEDNDELGSETPLVAGVARDAIVCPGDADRYRVPVDVGCIADLNVTFAHAQGDIDAELLRPDATVLVGSRSVTDDERILKVITAPGMTYRVVLFGSDPDGNTYRIRVDQTCEGALACPADDPFEPNDARESPRRVERNGDEVLGVICGDNQDFFDVIPQSGCTLGGELSLDPAQGDLDLELIQLDGTRIAVSQTTQATERIDYAAPNGTRVIFRVYSFTNPTGAAQKYRLRLTNTCP